MSEGHTVTDETTHKLEKPSRIRSDEEDREKIREKLQSCIDPLDHPDRVIHTHCHWQNLAREGKCAECCLK